MKKSVFKHLLHFLLVTFIFSGVCTHNHCWSQKPFIVGGQGTWGKKGRPYAYNGAKISIFDIACMDAYLSGINISLICSKVRGINGFSYAPYSLCDQVKGFQIALISKVTTLKGLQIGIINKRTHFVKPSVKAGNYGLQLGLMNATFTNFGIQLGLFNSSWSGHKGLSIGAININSLFQIGLINIKNDFNKGTQIGIFNYRKGNKWFAKVLPIMNFKIERKESF